MWKTRARTLRPRPKIAKPSKPSVTLASVATTDPQDQASLRQTEPQLSLTEDRGAIVR